jgi:hypothetical protein
MVGKCAANSKNDNGFVDQHARADSRIFVTDKCTQSFRGAAQQRTRNPAANAAACGPWIPDRASSGFRRNDVRPE